MANVYNLYCEICNWKRITNGSPESLSDLYELTLADVPGGVPVMDAESKKIKERPSQKRQRRFRCPQCGRTVHAKQMKDPQAKVEAYREELRRQNQAQQWYDEDAVHRAEYEKIKQSYTEDNRDDE